jgi:hypothetical protein
MHYPMNPDDMILSAAGKRVSVSELIDTVEIDNATHVSASLVRASATLSGTSVQRTMRCKCKRDK